MKNVELKIKGMSCSHCTKSVEDTLKDLSGVISVNVSLENANAVVEFDDSKVSIDTIIESIKELEYEVSL